MPTPKTRASDRSADQAKPADTRSKFRRRLSDLYLGRTVTGRRFRLGLIVVDALTLGGVILASFWPAWPGWTGFYVARIWAESGDTFRTRISCG